MYLVYVFQRKLLLRENTFLFYWLTTNFHLRSIANLEVG